MINYTCDGCGKEITPSNYGKNEIDNGFYCDACAAIVHVIVGDLTAVKKIDYKTADTKYTAEKKRLIEEQCYTVLSKIEMLEGVDDGTEEAMSGRKTDESEGLDKSTGRADS